MAILARRKFRRDGSYWYGTNGECFCDVGVRNLFAVPRRTNELVASLHDKDGKGRMRAEIDNTRGYYRLMLFSRSGENLSNIGSDGYSNALRKLGCREVWVEVTYYPR